MAKTASTMLQLETQLPKFKLPDSSGKMFEFENTQKPLLVIFICNHCPFVIHIQPALIKLGLAYKDELKIIAINANDVEAYPEDHPSEMKKHQALYSFPYLFDETQAVAKQFQAACTPDFFLFDANEKLVYRGQFDESRPSNNIVPDGRDIRDAVDALLKKKPVSQKQISSLGCNIKWKPGNEPNYFHSS